MEGGDVCVLENNLLYFVFECEVLITGCRVGRGFRENCSKEVERRERSLIPGSYTQLLSLAVSPHRVMHIYLEIYYKQ